MWSLRDKEADSFGVRTECECNWEGTPSNGRHWCPVRHGDRNWCFKGDSGNIETRNRPWMYKRQRGTSTVDECGDREFSGTFRLQLPRKQELIGVCSKRRDYYFFVAGGRCCDFGFFFKRLGHWLTSTFPGQSALPSKRQSPSRFRRSFSCCVILPSRVRVGF